MLFRSPLVDTEQFSGGGLATVRGYLEGEAAGDDGIFGTVELRSPSVLNWLGEKSGEWRFYVFGDAGTLRVQQPSVGQHPNSPLSSVGVGSRIRFRDHLSGAFDLGLPCESVPLKPGTPTTGAGDWHLTFSIRADY